MATFKQMHSVYLKNGRKIPVTFLDWGRMKFSGQDLIDFNNEVGVFLEQVANAVTEGTIVTENIIENFNSSVGHSIEQIVGIISHRTGASIPPHEIKLKWETIMEQDPDIIVFNPDILITN
jgi:hypothetical protein